MLALVWVVLGILVAPLGSIFKLFWGLSLGYWFWLLAVRISLSRVDLEMSSSLINHT